MPDPDVLALHAGLAPGRPAVREGGSVTTYAELNEEVNRLASGLLALGIRNGDCAVWCGPNSREVLVFASLVIDSVVRAINAQRVSAESKEVGLEN